MHAYVQHAYIAYVPCINLRLRKAWVGEHVEPTEQAQESPPAVAAQCGERQRVGDSPYRRSEGAGPRANQNSRSKQRQSMYVCFEKDAAFTWSAPCLLSMASMHQHTSGTPKVQHVRAVSGARGDEIISRAGAPRSLRNEARLRSSQTALEADESNHFRI